MPQPDNAGATLSPRALFVAYVTVTALSSRVRKVVHLSLIHIVYYVVEWPLGDARVCL